MDFRVLQYFLAVAREQSFSGAAELLHLSQPTLSRQLKELEAELGKQLFVRSSRGVSLTEEGMLLRKRAEEICDLVQKTKGELTASEESIAGDVSIGAGESSQNRIIAQAAHAVQRCWPDIRFRISSGNAAFVSDQLDKGLVDFGVLYGNIAHNKYESLPVPFSDRYGVLMRRDSPLAQKEYITAEDLYTQPLIVSNQELESGWPTLRGVITDTERLNVAATYTLLFNGSQFVEEGIGCALCFEGLINTCEDSPFRFRPLYPAVVTSPHIVWKRHQKLTKASEKFLEQLRLILAQQE